MDESHGKCCDTSFAAELVAAELSHLRTDILNWVMAVSQKLNVIQDSQARMEQNMATSQEQIDAISAVLDTVGTSLDQIAKDTSDIATEISNLQAGQVTQASLDSLAAKAQGVADRVAAESSALDAVDASGAPPAPPVPPVV